MYFSETDDRKRRSLPVRYRRDTTDTTIVYSTNANLTELGNVTTTPAPPVVKKYKEPGRLRRSNSASTLLGLTFLLYPDKHEYGIAMNHFKGFRV